MDGGHRERLWRLVTERMSDGATGGAAAVCAVAVDQLGVDAAAITVRATTRTQQLVATTGKWAKAREELQYTVGEGPGVTAFTTGEPVLVSDPHRNAHRWPGFWDGAAGAGVGAVFAFPLQVGAIRVGTLDLYRRRPGGLDAWRLGAAATLADMATTAVLADAESDPVASWAGGDDSGYYDEVNIATGMLATQLQVSLEDAFLRLRAHAFSHRLSVTEVAKAVLNRRLRLDTSVE